MQPISLRRCRTRQDTEVHLVDWNRLCSVLNDDGAPIVYGPTLCGATAAIILRRGVPGESCDNAQPVSCRLCVAEATAIATQVDRVLVGAA